MKEGEARSESGREREGKIITRKKRTSSLTLRISSNSSAKASAILPIQNCLNRARSSASLSGSVGPGRISGGRTLFGMVGGGDGERAFFFLEEVGALVEVVVVVRSGLERLERCDCPVVGWSISISLFESSEYESSDEEEDEEDEEDEDDASFLAAIVVSLEDFCGSLKVVVLDFCCVSFSEDELSESEEMDSDEEEEETLRRFLFLMRFLFRGGC